MIYSNVDVCAEERKLDFGTLYQVAVGSFGRGRKPVVLTAPQGCTLRNGANPNFTIGVTKSGKPRIVATTGDDSLYLLVDSYGGYSRRGCGYVHLLSNAEAVVVGNGADGDAGRIGQWDIILVKFTAPVGVVRMLPSGGRADYTYFIAHGGNIFRVEAADMDAFLDTLCEQDYATITHAVKEV